MRPTVPTVSEQSGRMPVSGDWVVADTLAGPEQPSMILEGSRPRAFSRLSHANIARNPVAARAMTALVREVAESEQTRDKFVRAADDLIVRAIGVPIPGPSGQVHAVAVWAGAPEDALPKLPVVGALEWSRSGVITANPAAMFLFRAPGGDLLVGRTIPETLAAFDSWSDRPGFLALFNLDHSTAATRWTGTATKMYEDGELHQLHIAARAIGAGEDRVVRAIVCDISGHPASVDPDLLQVSLRHMPIQPGHAVGVVDLRTGFVHEWMAPENSPLAGWRHHNPDYDADGRAIVAGVCYQLATGAQSDARIKLNVRFSPVDEWILLDSKWTRISGGDRPQALLDVTPVSWTPAPVAGCVVCQDMARRAALASAEEPPAEA